MAVGRLFEHQSIIVNMAWSIADVEQKLLNGNIDTIAMPAEMILEAVNRAENVLGPEWMAACSSAKGLAPTLDIIGTGFRLASIDSLAGSEKLIKQIRRKDQSADAELTAIHLFRSNDPVIELELYPAVGFRKADFRVRRGAETWITVEATEAFTSKEQKRLQSILRRLTDALINIDAQFVLELQFRREPTEAEIIALCVHLPDFCRLPGQQNATLADGMGWLFLDHVEIGRIRLHEIPELADTPMIGIIMFPSGGPGGTPHHQVAVRIPFSDKRAEEFLRSEAKQLPKEGPGLVMICGPTSPNELKVWTELIQRRLQPKINTRIAGVCLFSGGMEPVGKKYGWLLRTTLIINPHARVPLPKWVQTVIASASGTPTQPPIVRRI
jgi:hypothetical protein